MPITINTSFAENLEREMSNGNDPIYEYCCYRCGDQFESSERNRVYCQSAECDGKGGYKNDDRQ